MNFKPGTICKITISVKSSFGLDPWETPQRIPPRTYTVKNGRRPNESLIGFLQWATMDGKVRYKVHQNTRFPIPKPWEFVEEMMEEGEPVFLSDYWKKGLIEKPAK